MDAISMEEQIEVGDLPNFRSEGKFDVDQVVAAGPDASAASWDGSAAYDMPDVIRTFIVFFHKQLKEGNQQEVHAIYESSFNKLSERFYKSAPWPPADAISPLVGADGQFMLLYKELYYRHIYSKLQPTLEQRTESWANYCALFDMLVDAKAPVKLELPSQWLWDIIDEFIYQFQTFCQFRARVKSKSEEELATLKGSPQTWAVAKVLTYLEALTAKSGIRAQLQGAPAGASAPFAADGTYQQLGYFAMVGSLRMHCLLGDYRLALQSVSEIDLARKGPAPHGLYTRVASCHIALHYYVGWCYLMLRRWPDATKTFSNVLFYISRTKQYHTRSHGYDQIIKKNEQMYALLAIAASLSPSSGDLDEALLPTLHEKYVDKMARAGRGDAAAYEELFAFACPKFVSAAPPNYEQASEPGYNPQEAYRLQLRLFLNEVEQQKMLPTVRSYLKLYTTIGVPKLAALAETDEPTFREHLQCLKHKTRAPSHAAGAPLSGEFASSAGVDFYVGAEVAHVAEPATGRKHSEYFVRQIHKLDEIITALK